MECHDIARRITSQHATACVDTSCRGNSRHITAARKLRECAGISHRATSCQRRSYRPYGTSRHITYLACNTRGIVTQKRPGRFRHIMPLKLRLNLMGAETRKQNWHAILFSYGPDSYIDIRLLLCYGVLCKYAGGSLELEGRVTAIFDPADTQEYTVPTHPVWYPPDSMGLALADSSFLKWVGFLRRSIQEQCVDIAESSTTQRQPARACGVCSRLLIITGAWSL